MTLAVVFTWFSPEPSQGWDVCWAVPLWLLGWTGGTQRGTRGLGGAVAKLKSKVSNTQKPQNLIEFSKARSVSLGLFNERKKERKEERRKGKEKKKEPAGKEGFPELLPCYCLHSCAMRAVMPENAHFGWFSPAFASCSCPAICAVQCSPLRFLP